MKIISQEYYPYNVNYITKDLLIPCYVYKIPIEIDREKKLNFIEETVLKLINVDDSLKSDIVRLSKLIGFYSEKKEEDKTKIVKLIVEKIKNLRLDEVSAEKQNTEVKIYQFYQEAYTNELLPIITQEIEKFALFERNTTFNDSNYREIFFRQKIDSKNSIRAILATNYNEEFYQPSKEDIIKTIFLHNQSKYKESHIINYKNFKIDMVAKPELMFLHTKLLIPKDNIQYFVITNGFTRDFSTHLRRVFEHRHQDLLKIIKDESRQDIDSNIENEIPIPFKSQIFNYPDLVKEMRNIEKNIHILQKDDSSIDEVKRSKGVVVESLYDLMEKTFSILVEKLTANKSLTNRRLLKNIAIQMGFDFNRKQKLSIFNVHGNENFQKYLAKSLIYKKNELYEVAVKFPMFLLKMEKIFPFRNAKKHSEREEILKKLTLESLAEYKDIFYRVVSIILHIELHQQKAAHPTIESDDDAIYYNHAFLDLEDELGIDVVKSLPAEVKDNLLVINFALNDMDFDTNKYAIVKDVLNNLYSSLEHLWRKKIVDLPEKASLGYIYNYLKSRKIVSDDDLVLIHKVIELRKHGNPTLEEVASIDEPDLRYLKDNCFMYIKKLIEGKE